MSEKKNKFKFYIFPNSKKGGFTYEKVRDEVEKDLETSDITATDLQKEMIGQIVTEENRKEVSKRTKNDKYIDSFVGYTSSIIQDFENYLRSEVDLVEDDIRFVWDEKNSNFITNELPPVIYNFKDFSEFLSRYLQFEDDGINDTVDIEFDDNSMKTKLFVRPGHTAIEVWWKINFQYFPSFQPTLGL